jgi:diguanylate cyclase (GGDEF)-like protein
MRTAAFTLFAMTQAQLRAKLLELSHLASRDFLTGLPNGHAFYQLTAKEMDRAFGVEPMTLVCIDITGFKWINHRFGYPAGDHMMCAIAHSIRQHVPRPDLVGRMGGTNFAVLLPNVGSDVAHLILQRVQNALDEERRKYAHPLTFFISAIACTKAPRTVAELLQEADAQMTRIKNGKKDSLQIAKVDHLPALN